MKKKRGKPGKTKTKRPGRGGAWRAWVRLRTHGQPFRSIDHKAEAARYRAAAAAETEEYKAAVRLGQAGTGHGRRTGRHAFGGRASQALRSQQRVQQAGLALQMGAWAGDAAGGALALANLARATESTVEDALAVARRLARLQSAERQAAKVAAEETLQRHRVTIGADAVRAVQRAIPELAALPMTGEPSAFGFHISVDMPEEEETKAAVGWLSANSQASGLAKRLEGLWSLLHRTLMETDCPEVPTPPPASRCREVGVCICSDEGLDFDRRVTRVRNHLKAVCPPGTPRREQLVEGKLLLRITGRPTDYEEMLAEGGEPLVDLWLHIGLMYLSPYEPVFHIVERIADPGEVAPDPRRIYVRSTGVFSRLHRGLLPLRKSSSMWCKWYALEHAERPVADFAPQPVAFLEFANWQEARRIWPRAEAAPRGRGGAGPAGAPQRGADEQEADLLEEEGELAGEGPDEAAAEEPPAFAGLLEHVLEAFEGGGLLGAPGAGEIREVPAAGGAAGGPDPAAAPADPEVPPPAPAGPLPARRRRQRANEQLSVLLPNGMITYYPSNGRFEAKCSVHAEARCTLTRRGIGEEAAMDAPAGSVRPLGLLSAWLAVATLHEDKGAHRGPDVLRMLSSAEQRQYRLDCRRELAGCPGAEDLFQREAPAAGQGLEEEPETVR